jgi:hypothetical protein
MVANSKTFAWEARMHTGRMAQGLRKSWGLSPGLVQGAQFRHPRSGISVSQPSKRL